MLPEALLPDEINSVEANGVTVRKGSVGAFLASWRTLNDPHQDATSHAAAKADLLALLPALTALGLFDVFIPRDPYLAELIAQHNEQP